MRYFLQDTILGTGPISNKGLQGRLLFVYFTHNIAAGAHDMALY